ncbi:hypothetical protein EVAR_31913_1 [Eumeta japonica]|uniref:Uncharacterized protein n=1 Tax=Eumeta variegata TaxID=151549 RepID=A0A4C1XM03_EUMVA|nr:hypothetical protein EVAR_31913_1 [Eumeta japonica]
MFLGVTAIVGRSVEDMVLREARTRRNFACCERPLSLLLGRIGRWSRRETTRSALSLARSRSRARLRRNATMSHAAGGGGGRRAGRDLSEIYGRDNLHSRLMKAKSLIARRRRIAHEAILPPFR